MTPTEGGHESLLLVEDQEDVRRLAFEILEACGYKVMEAADGAEALQYWNILGQSIDLLITDVIMPDISGLELAAKLRSRHPKLKVLFISGYAGDNIVLEKEVAHLQKPFSPDALAKKVREVLGPPA